MLGIISHTEVTQGIAKKVGLVLLQLLRSFFFGMSEKGDSYNTHAMVLVKE